MMAPEPSSLRCIDLFCAVIDNFGDAGVSWRLARQLVAEHHLKVRLWIDRPEVLARLTPGLAPELAQQWCQGVEVRQWDARMPAPNPADVFDVVIEAFGCPLPTPWLQAMAARPRAPVWINLEYLTAEGWVEGCHGLPSPHPVLPLCKHFFFPGFTVRTGGLLREEGLISRRERFAANPLAATRVLSDLGVANAGEDTVVVSLFCYAEARLSALLDAWQNDPAPVVCLVPQPVARFLPPEWGLAGAAPGARVERGRLVLQVIPFLAQDRYDELLWSCDLNFVRGEDSFVRAQWAGRPMVWQAYRQAEDAHHDKVAAFLDCYLKDAPAELDAVVRQAIASWNGMAEAELDWPSLRAALPALGDHARNWAGQLGSIPSLASALAEFARSRVK